MVSILILTKNEEQDLPGCLASVDWSDDVHVLDSLSTDGTINIAKSHGAKVTQRRFDNWSAHQNWALGSLSFRHPWVLYLDADERVSPALRDAIWQGARADAAESAFRIRRRDYFEPGCWLEHVQISPYFIRLLRPAKVRYERLVNPVTVVDGIVGDMDGYLDHYPFSKGVGFWVERHVRYAELEARMIVEGLVLRPSLRKVFLEPDFNERRRHQKALFYRLPCRPIVKWLYLMVVRRAFLDGRSGWTYAALQSIYEYFIVLKTREMRKSACGSGLPGGRSLTAGKCEGRGKTSDAGA